MSIRAAVILFFLAPCLGSYLRIITPEEGETRNAGEQKLIFDSGTPPDSLMTGGVIWKEQTLAVRFRSINEEALIMASVKIFLQTERIDLTVGADLTLALCPSKDGNDDEPDTEQCLGEETFGLAQSHLIEYTWEPTFPNRLIEPMSFYWLIVKGNALEIDKSFSWVDGTNMLGSESAVISAFTTDGSNWQRDAIANGATTFPTCSVMGVEYTTTGTGVRSDGSVRNPNFMAIL